MDAQGKLIEQQIQNQKTIEVNAYECKFELKSWSPLRMVIQLTIDKTAVLGEDDIVHIIFLETFDGEEPYRASGVVNSVYQSYNSQTKSVFIEISVNSFSNGKV